MCGMATVIKASVFLDSRLHKAAKKKAGAEKKSLSQIVSEALASQLELNIPYQGSAKWEERTSRA